MRPVRYKKGPRSGPAKLSRRVKPTKGKGKRKNDGRKTIHRGRGGRRVQKTR